VTVLELLALDSLVALTDHAGLGKDDFAVDDLRLRSFLVLFVLHFPQLDYAVVCRQKLNTTIFVEVQEI